MPELPEVETTCRGIAPHILNKRISHIEVRQPKLRWPVTPGLSDTLRGRRIEGVSRRAKYLLLETGGDVLLIHLGMSGSLRIVSTETPPLYHDHIDVDFEDGTRLRFNDPRRFGSFMLIPSTMTASHQLLSGLGPEPLSDILTGEHLYTLSRRRKASVKTFIMDQRIVVGVGNIYANEALFRSGIRPGRAAGQISKARYQRLAEEIKSVLAAAIEMGGTTLRDFVGGDGKPGYFQQTLMVYGRGGKPCRQCGAPLREIRLGQRATVYCLNCQS